MTARLRRKLAAVPARFAGGLDRIENAAVAGAAAQVAVERFRHGRAIVGLSAIDQGGGADDDAGDAEAALHAALEEEGLAQHSTRFFRKPLDRRHLAAVHLLGLALA